jgi:hypothetical protein
MSRLTSIFCLLLGCVPPVAADLPPLPVKSVEVPVPAAPGATGASLTTAPDGTVWLSWLEPAAEGTTLLRCATLDSAVPAWTAPRTVAHGSDWLVSEADPPSLAVEPGGRLTAVWLARAPASSHASADNPGHSHLAGSAAFISQSTDRGRTWSTAVRLTRESTSVEFVSLQALDDGRVLAAWLDGRGKHDDHGTQQLFSRVIGRAGSDQLVDDSVCDCCRTTLARFADGSALLAYRGRTADEVRDIHVARFQDNQWTAGRVLSSDDWRIAGCPVNGPQLAAQGGRAVAVWFTAAGGEPRVLASVTPDAGARFLQPLRLDRGHPLGRVDTVMLADGSVLATWLEGGGDQPGLWLRRLTLGFEPGQAVRLAPLNPTHFAGFPRITLIKDYDTTPARLAVVFTGDDPAATLHTRLVTLPDLSTLAGRKPCVPCDEDDAQAVRGFPMKGRIVSVVPEHGSLIVQHDEIPGVMRAMTMELQADPDVLAAAAPNRELLARIERRGKSWWIFGVRWLGEQ